MRPRPSRRTNVASDDRGFVYIVDRANSGMHVLRADWRGSRNRGLNGDDASETPGGNRCQAPIPQSSPPFETVCEGRSHESAFATHCTSAVIRARREPVAGTYKRCGRPGGKDG